MISKLWDSVLVYLMFPIHLYACSSLSPIITTDLVFSLWAFFGPCPGLIHCHLQLIGHPQHFRSIKSFVLSLEFDETSLFFDEVSALFTGGVVIQGVWIRGRALVRQQ